MPSLIFYRTCKILGALGGGEVWEGRGLLVSGCKVKEERDMK